MSTRTYPRLQLPQIVGLLIASFAYLIPALIGSGFVEDVAPLPISVSLIIAATGGAIGGALLMPRAFGISSYVVGGVCGAVGCVGALGLTAWWTADRESVMKFELVMTGVLGALPGLVPAAIWYRRRRVAK